MYFHNIVSVSNEPKKNQHPLLYKNQLITTIADLIKVLNRMPSQEMDFEDNTLRGEKPMAI